MAAFMCMGDFICLYCENTNGYVYSDQTSSTCDGLFVYTDQERDLPAGVPSVHAITFQVASQNRYKLTKRYRSLVEQHGSDPDDPEVKRALGVAKSAADTESQDNEGEQSRLQGKNIRYGDTIQLRHVFTNKFVHVSTTETSVVDKSKMMVTLQADSSKRAQFRIMPRYKVKTEGEKIEEYDQIVLESVKSPETFLHASDPYEIDRLITGCELNVGVDRAGFTWVKHYRPEVNKQHLLKGGALVRLFHKDLEAYLTAEGVFGEDPTEKVHLRIRERNQSDPRTLYNPKSGITYWQVELGSSIVKGEPIKWEDTVRFRHMTTRRYLCITANHEVVLTSDGFDPLTVFRVHSVSQTPTTREMSYGCQGRIEHSVLSHWLHAPIDSPYERQQGQLEDSSSGQALRWDRASLVKVVGSASRQYPDAFTFQKVSEDEVNHFNYVAGMIPFIKELTDRTLKDIQAFVINNGIPRKDRQKLLRNLRLVDVMVDLLKTPVPESLKDYSHLSQVFRSVYEVLHCYTQGQSKKNSLYLAHYIPFFMTQLLAKDGLGIQCCRMLIDLLRDNRKIVDRITPAQLDQVIGLLKKQQHHIYLELLRVLSVCHGIAMSENQTQIAINLLERQKDSMYHLELGQDIGLVPDLIYVSTSNRERWIPLHTFSYKSNADYSVDSYLFLEKQLALYKDICYGRNKKAVEVITRNREFFTWEVAYVGVRCEVLPDRMRATFCDLLIGLFVDVGDNYSIISVTSNNFVFDEVKIENQGRTDTDNVPHDFDSHFPTLRVWIFAFLQEHRCLAASQPSRNILIKEVLRLVTCLIRYGFLGSSTEMEAIMTPVLDLINGQRDVPFPPDKGADYSNEQRAVVNQWRRMERYEPGPNTDAIIEAKIQGLDLIDLLLIKSFNQRIRYFVAVFKDLEQRENLPKKRQRRILGKLLYRTFDKERMWSPKLRAKIWSFLKMMDKTDHLKSELSDILFDLTKYKSEVMISKTLAILTKLYSSKTDVFRTTERTQVLTAVESVRVHRDALRSMVVLTRLSNSKLNQEMADEMTAILLNFKELCYVPHKLHMPHPVGQNILVNNGLLTMLLPLVTQEVDTKLQDQFLISKQVIGSGLDLLRYLAQRNGYVQGYLMERLEDLLGVQCCGEAQALALQEIFRGNTVHCLRLQPHHVQKMVRLAGHYRQEAPQFLQLLSSIMKMDVSGTLLKRNQHLVTKSIMENYKSAAYVMNKKPRERLRILIGREGTDHQTYLVNFVSLLATCAEGESRYVESLCQTLLSLDEVLLILNNRYVAIHHKVAFVRYLVWAYMRTARTFVESGVDELSHDTETWKHIRIIWTLARNIINSQAIDGYEGNTLKQDVLLVDNSTLKVVQETKDEPINDADVITYMLRGGFLFIQTFFWRFYQPDKDSYPKEVDTLKRLASVLFPLAELAGRAAESHNQLQHMVECLEVVIRRLNLSKTVLSSVFDQAKFNSSLIEMESTLESAPCYYNDREESKLNDMLHNFGHHLTIFLQGKNTLETQLGVHGIVGRKAYNPEELEVPFPLGEEFQTHVRSFADYRGKSIMDNKVYKLIDHLATMPQQRDSRDKNVDDDLDIRCVQILRALIYNRVVRLPENWGDDVKKHQKTLDGVKRVQDMLIEYDMLRKILPLLERKNLAVGLEVLSLIDLVFFNANRTAQEAMMKYFKTTSEEVFFIFLRARIQDAVFASKERRSIAAQKKAKAKQAPVTSDKEDDKENKDSSKTPWELTFDKHAVRKKSLAPFFRQVIRNRRLARHGPKEAPHEVEIELSSPALREEPEEEGDAPTDRFHDGSAAVLGLRVIGRLCDGQYQDAQEYLQAQPDNPVSVDLVAQLALFLGTVYTHVQGDSISITCQIFSTINEVCQGIQENRAVILNNKIIDYINFILRMGSFEGCEPQEVIELKTEIGHVLISLIEENDVAALQLAKEIRDTIDVKRLLRHIVAAHSLVTGERSDPIRLICGLQSTEPTESTKGLFSRKVRLDKELFEDINECGFLYYFILARLFDIDKNLEKRELTDPEDRKAFRYFRNQCTSIEVIKDDCLQKVYFRVKDRDLLREEVKEQVKWNIDRTSPSNKLRALISWTKDIVADITYQKRFLSNPFVKQLAKRWAIWNYACILLSLLIQVMMLATWYAPMNYEDIPANATELPTLMTAPTPRLEWKDFGLVLWILGACHNFCSLVLFIAYLLLSHPSLPSFTSKLSKLCKRKEEDAEDEVVHVEKNAHSRLQAKLFSATTVYYLLLMTLSFAGTFFYGYFFAFHLVNIVANNELLKGVIKAVTQNGKSLLWVMIMGLIIIYLYGLIGFAFLRPLFNPDEEMYCGSLAECVVTVMRYGVIGDISENFKMHDLEKNFKMFGILTLYQLTFFILFTTIGLNIIFGIIVDTFSEMRDLKWMAEKDMRDTCFICSRDSYDFEHEGRGFIHHVHQEHNMWAYVFFFLYLSQVKPNDYTSIEKHVAELLKQDKMDFFPLNRALCLSAHLDDDEATKLDDVMDTLTAIQSKQEEDEKRQLRDAERRRQAVWQDQFRRRRDGVNSMDNDVENELYGEYDSNHSTA